MYDLCDRPVSPAASTICTTNTCRDLLSRAHVGVQLADIWHDPPVLDLLLAAIYPMALTGKLDLLVDCPFSHTPTVLEMLQKLPAVVTLKTHLTSSLNEPGKNLQLNTSLMGYYYGSSLLAGGLVWACNSYSGLLVSALGQLKIPSFVNNQFLLANASPDLKTAFANTWQPLISPPDSVSRHHF